MYQNNLLTMAVTRKVVEVHISTISNGDSIICADGFERTVSKGNINKKNFLGITIFGDSCRLGSIPVKKVIYEKTDISLNN